MDQAHHLVITALGEDRPGIVNELSKTVFSHGCGIVDSRMAVLGGEFALILMAAGPDEALGALEAALQARQADLGLTITSKRTSPRRAQAGHQPCRVKAVAIDHPGIVHRLAGFFSERSMNIEHLNTDRYAAAHTGTPMFALTMVISVPPGIRLSELREQFIAFCDELNIDAVIEPATREPVLTEP